MAEFIKLPVGIENFEKIRRDGFYYVDKTGLIEQLLNNWGEVNLFTRPRRFGKTLNMSMLKYFFEIGADQSLFEGLYISKNKALCDAYMGKYPVISISLKGVNADSYENARSLLKRIVMEEAKMHRIIMSGNRLDDIDKAEYMSLVTGDMGEDTLVYSMKTLTALLEKYYEKKVIVLIDEYDVPLAKANENGYYDQMVLLVRNLFENVLKTNSSLKFAVLTGCLRVAKESIFTGLNNFKTNSILDEEYDETFGFVDDEVKEMLHYYGQDTHYETVKEWYDGYRFGNADVYCPWDVINYCDAHRRNPMLPPENYWTNTSGNDVLKHFIESAGAAKGLAKTDLERLVNGEIVEKDIREDLTYNELYASMDNLWSTLFMAGYLTHKGRVDTKRFRLAVPNREIRNIITEQVLALFKQNVEKDGQLLNDFCTALSDGHTDEVERLFSEYMKKTISVRDTFARKELKENFYHGLLLGILGFKAGWSVMSNRESGNGFSDIMIMIDDAEIGIVIEVKYAESHDLEAVCKDALKQMIDKRYAEYFEQQGIKKILKYGIACRVKECKVMLEEN
uniref:AAA family ATPase n=1 Tax=Roseburia inulinivorans TaxID=360807 RepID=UPI0040264287